MLELSTSFLVNYMAAAISGHPVLRFIPFTIYIGTVNYIFHLSHAIGSKVTGLLLPYISFSSSLMSDVTREEGKEKRGKKLGF